MANAEGRCRRNAANSGISGATDALTDCVSGLLLSRSCRVLTHRRGSLTTLERLYGAEVAMGLGQEAKGRTT